MDESQLKAIEARLQSQCPVRHHRCIWEDQYHRQFEHKREPKESFDPTALISFARSLTNASERKGHGEVELNSPPLRSKRIAKKS